MLEAQGSVLTNKYAEGYPGKRYYGGCEFVDVAEQLAIERAKKLFGADYANVQPHSGSQANMAVYLALLQPGDTILGMSLDHGGHLTHGAKVNFSGKLFNAVQYGLDTATGEIDYDAGRAARARAPAEDDRRGLLRVLARDRLAAIPRDRGRGRRLVRSSTWRTSRASSRPACTRARCRIADVVDDDDAQDAARAARRPDPRARERRSCTKKLNSIVFPGTQGGPLMHVIAAKAVAFLEALQPEFKAYQQQVVANARAMVASRCRTRGYRIVSGGTDNHLFLLDLIGRDITGKDADAALGRAHITVNKNAVPNDPRPPFVTSGLRIGHARDHDARLRRAEVARRWRAGSPTSSTTSATTRRRSRVRERGARSVPAFPGLRLSAREAAASALPVLQPRRHQGDDSRLAGEGQQIRRRRECLSCGERFTTFEIRRARDAAGRQERPDARSPSTRRSCAPGCMKALEKRPVARDAVEAALERIGHRLRVLGEREVASRTIGEIVMEELRTLDEVAYVRFASVYRRFQDVDAFREEIEQLDKSRQQRSRRPDRCRSCRIAVARSAAGSDDRAGPDRRGATWRARSNSRARGLVHHRPESRASAACSRDGERVDRGGLARARRRTACGSRGARRGAAGRARRDRLRDARALLAPRAARRPARMR